MIHWFLVKIFLLIFVASLFGTFILEFIFRFFGTRGYLGNLFPNIRGGIPKGMGLIPFILLSLLMLPDFNFLILIIGIFAFLDDIVGTTPSLIGIEFGQLTRVIGFILVIVFGFYFGLGLSSILIALMIQPFSVSDRQPGSTCMLTMILCILTIIVMFIVGSPDYLELPAYYTPLVIFIIVLGYCHLDFGGRIMLGEVGNHSLAVALGCAFYLVGGFWAVLILFIVSICLTVFVRRNTLAPFLIGKLGIPNPTFGDFFMDVLTGGSLGDLIRGLVFGTKQKNVTSKWKIKLGFRRLYYNPYAPNHGRYESSRRLDRG